MADGILTAFVNSIEAEYTYYIRVVTFGNIVASFAIDVLICPEEIDEITNSFPDKVYAGIDPTIGNADVFFDILVPKMLSCLTIT